MSTARTLQIAPASDTFGAAIRKPRQSSSEATFEKAGKLYHSPSKLSITAGPIRPCMVRLKFGKEECMMNVVRKSDE